MSLKGSVKRSCPPIISSFVMMMILWNKDCNRSQYSKEVGDSGKGFCFRPCLIKLKFELFKSLES